MSDRTAADSTPGPDSTPDPDSTSGPAPEADRPLAESGHSPERVEHVDVDRHDDVDQDALDIAESTSSDEPPP